MKTGVRDQLPLALRGKEFAMNSAAQKPLDSGSGSGEVPVSGGFEETLRMIAGLAAPEGLENRVRASLLAAPRRGRVLSWPAALRQNSGWMRRAAAAGIVFVVVGGGWGVYSRVQQGQPAKMIVLPPREAAPGGFSSGGAMRVPQTLQRPVVNRAAKAQAPKAKVPARMAQKPKQGGQATAPGKTEAQPVAPAAK
jgi:hypothetical protein